ncbi:MAG: amidohydrolase family protein, partial [Leucothrix sp.]
GHHIHNTTAKLAIANKTQGKTLLVTDAMATIGSKQDSFDLYGETIYAIDGRCTNKDGKLAGSALDMATAVRNCVKKLDIPLPEALRMASLYPAEFLGVSDQYGLIKPGYRADLVLLDTEQVVQKTWVLGELCFSQQ